MQKRIVSLVAGCLLFTLFSGCGTTPSRPTDDSAQVEARVERLLESARESESPQREQQVLEAARLLLILKQADQARQLLVTMDSRRLADPEFIRHTLLLSELAIADGGYFLAQRVLTNPRLENIWHNLDPADEITLRQRRARIFSLLGDTTASVRERMQLTALLQDPEEEQRNQDLLWQSLLTLPLAQLQELAVREEDRQLRGWYALAAVSRIHQGNLERQLTQVDAWLENWPDHPASRQLPGDLQVLRELIENQPRHVALLLPQRGHLAAAAEAVRDGFFAAYYQAIAEESRIPQIRQYDSDGADIIALYQQAVSEGAEIVIGPLDREQVNELSMMLSLPVPVLTLNYADASPVEQDGYLYQFGLAAEDEARQVARQAHLDGHSHAMILIPDQGWSERSAQAFTHLWQDLGGTTVNYSRFGGGDYSTVIGNALLIERSRARHQQLTRLLGTTLEFEPRRRQDVDMIFLLASPSEARQVKPTLAFHYAADLPVYSTSHIYSGVPDSVADRDLNGIRFTTMPWLFDSQSAEKQAVDRHSRSGTIYSRLHALGVDSYRLYPRLQQLAQTEHARLYGATGTLRLLPDGRIEREQIWAEFRGGTARPVPTAGATASTRP